MANDTLAQSLLAYIQTTYPILCISTEGGSTTLATVVVAGTPPTNGALGIASASQAIPAGVLYLDYNGTGVNGSAPQEPLLTTGCAQGATSLSVTTIDGTLWTPAYSHAIGVSVIPMAPATDNPTATPPNAQFLTLASGDYSAIGGSGDGNRTLTLTKKFPGATTTPGTYNVVRLVKSHTFASGNTGATCYVPQSVISNTSGNVIDQTFVITLEM